MSTTCPNGHRSETTDYCDQCGAPLENRSAAAPAGAKPPARASTEPPSDDASAAPHPTEVEVSPDTKPSVPAEPCPDCQTPRVGSDKFCEGCGYNFATGESSEHPASSPDPAAAPAPAEAPDSSQSPPPTAGLWEALVSADREYFERVAAEEIDFPSHCPPRRFVLDQREIGIGRRSPTRGTQPEIDLSGAPEDPAISHLHAILLRRDDGSYELLDPGSSNGITINDDPTPIAPNTHVPLADGDRVHIGAWTTMTIRHGEV
jgi:FHA domain